MSPRGNELVRLCSRRVENGRVGFNQVVLEQQEHPPVGLMLVGVDAERGLYLWLRPFDVVAPHSIPQAPGYSRALSPFDVADPPAFLGPPVFLPGDRLDSDLWEELPDLRTNSLNKALRQLFGLGE
jgi:hypothetical protein